MNPGTERYLIAWLERNMKLTEELARFNDNFVPATLEETVDFTRVDPDFVWCDHEGTVHGAEPDPYDYGKYVCPGPHSVILVGGEVEPLPGEIEAREHV